MSDPIVLIPARLAATRLPNKPLAEIAGEPMIVHVWRRALEAGMRIDAVLVDDVPLGVDTPHDLDRARDIIAIRRTS